MGKLVSPTNVYLDLLIDHEHGSLDWRAPSDELFVHPRNLIHPPGTRLYGRRLNDTMPPWETSPELTDQSHLTAQFAGIWAAATRETSR